MKLLLIVLTLERAAAVSSSSAFAREFGPSNDATSVMNRLTSLMGASKQKLGLAERHHKKLVKKIRNEAAAFLQAESSIYGKYLNNYAAELTQSIDDLENAALVAKVALAKAEAASSSSSDWRDPDVELRARLGAKVAAADRTVKKAQRMRAREVQEAEDRSEETMEDEAQKLGLKVGDMTPLIDEAKKTLETTVSKLRMPVLPKGLIDEPKNKKTPTTSAEKPAHGKIAGKTTTKTAVIAKVNLKALEDDVAKATKNIAAKTKDANKKLEGFLSKTDKDVAMKTAKIQQELEQRQTIELDKLLGRKATAKKVAVATKATATKNVAKTAVSGKLAAKVEKKVAATEKSNVNKKDAKNVVPVKVAVKAEEKVGTKNATGAKAVAKKSAAATKAAVAKQAVAAKVVAKASPVKVAVKAMQK